MIRRALDQRGAADAGVEIDSAFTQGATAPWLAMALGLVTVSTTGRSLTRALLLSSALSWNLGGKQKIPVRAMAVAVGIIFGVTVMAAIMNRIRDATGIAVASVAFAGVAAVYVVLWSVLYIALHRGTSDPGAALPGVVHRRRGAGLPPGGDSVVRAPTDRAGVIYLR